MIATGDAHTCALFAAGIECWGANGESQLGDGSTNDQHRPVAVVAFGSAAGSATPIAITAGSQHSCAILDDNSVWCWGLNNIGELGNGGTSSNPVTTAQKVAGLSAVEVWARGNGTCARTASGAVSCWGDANDGRLGNGGTSDVDTPAAVTGVTSATELAMGWDSRCVLETGGTVACWGPNWFGQCGDTTYNTHGNPAELPGLTGVVQLAVGGSHGCALKSDKTVACWGLDDEGQLGDGVTLLKTASFVQLACPK
jgi:alpha-tubulin suppressor-like RCC1 family protein